MPRAARHPLPSRRFVLAITILVLFNVTALVMVLAGGVPAQPWVFAAWFVGDIVVGLIALGLTERG